MKPQQVTKVIIDVTYLKHDIQPSWLDFTEAVYKRTFAGMRRNLSFVAHYLLRFPRCLLLVKTLVTRCEIRAGCSLKKLLVVEIHSFSFQNSLVTRCRSCSLQKVTRYSLQNSLVTRCKSCSLQKFIRYSLQNFLATCCRSCSLQKITRCSLRSALVNCCKK